MFYHYFTSLNILQITCWFCEVQSCPFFLVERFEYQTKPSNFP
uniref:Uncharacterized protein n=1 Tax=Nelumbo nucifera TaxID=4432 RepID=A0A822Y4B0_NELNU|nr:TPA_asm: hypothetical protein HUJ06_025932 [Nelumbo nucifera]